jgi:hypothetical protein
MPVASVKKTVHIDEFMTYVISAVIPKAVSRYITLAREHCDDCVMNEPDIMAAAAAAFYFLTMKTILSDVPDRMPFLQRISIALNAALPPLGSHRRIWPTLPGFLGRFT